MALFRDHVEDELWTLAPIADALLHRVATLIRGLPQSVPLRAGDALHLTTALEMGEREVWTSDRHLLGAASHFGIVGRTA